MKLLNATKVVIVLVVVLGIIAYGLFSLGAFSSISSNHDACIPVSGFLCSNVAYLATGDITATIGQDAGTNWTGWGVAYAPVGANITSNGSPSVKYYAMNGSLASGQTKTITLPVGTGVAAGAVRSVDIWVCYYTTTGAGVVGGTGSCTQAGGAGSSAVTYTKIATLTAKEM
jgi:hypothetical protein